jgi:aspartate beta-hydroxylase/beta-hydroxylase
VLDVNAVCPSLRLLEEKFQDIKAEYVAACQYVADAPRYHDIDSIQQTISNDKNDRNWRVMFLSAMGRKFKKNRARFPVAASIIDTIPNVFQAFISRLDPQKSIPVHSSPYAGYLRYHLALEIPVEDPPYMIVGDTSLFWTEGVGVMFDDTFPHHVVNASSLPRAVLIVDVERPMGLFGQSVHRMIVWILKHIYAKRIEKKLGSAVHVRSLTSDLKITERCRSND